jgi:hypothetical protein
MQAAARSFVGTGDGTSRPWWPSGAHEKLVIDDATIHGSCNARLGRARDLIGL